MHAAPPLNTVSSGWMVDWLTGWFACRVGVLAGWLAGWLATLAAQKWQPGRLLEPSHTRSRRQHHGRAGADRLLEPAQPQPGSLRGEDVSALHGAFRLLEPPHPQPWRLFCDGRIGAGGLLNPAHAQPP